MTNMIERDTVRNFLTDVHALAAHATQGMSSPGVLQLTRVHPADDKLTVSGRYVIGDVERMAEQAICDAENGFNSYIEARTVRKDLRRRPGKT